MERSRGRPSHLRAACVWLALLAACAAHPRSETRDAVSSEEGQAQAAAELVRQLEETRTDTGFAFGSFQQRLYAGAFASQGIDPATQTEQEALACLRAVGRPVEVARGLDGWARACMRAGAEHLELARTLTRLGVALDPDPARVALRRVHVQESLDGIRETALGLADRELAPTTALLLASTLSYADERERALAVLERALERHPDSYDLHLGLAYHLTRTRRPSRANEALDHLGRAIELDPQSALARVELGYALRAVRDLEGAQASCRAALEIDPQFTPAYRVLALIHRQAEQHAATIEDYRAILLLHPDEAMFLNSLANELATSPDVQLRRPAEAIRLAERAIELAPGQSWYVSTLGVCLYRAGELYRCIEVLESAIERSAGRASDHFYLAMAWKGAGEDEIAMECYREGLRRLENARSPRWRGFQRGERGYVAEARALLGLPAPPAPGQDGGAE